MSYKYTALVSITLGGVEFLPGKELPEGIDYQDLYDAGMVSRQKVEDRDPSIEQTTGPTPIEINKTKKKANGKRKNNSNR